MSTMPHGWAPRRARFGSNGTNNGRSLKTPCRKLLVVARNNSSRNKAASGQRTFKKGTFCRKPQQTTSLVISATAAIVAVLAARTARETRREHVELEEKH
uniref:Transmembrane protein n=1 Tax=Ascaris lumbricoides TaxID=6252 RepID=A0A0M3HU86_ASCLU